MSEKNNLKEFKISLEKGPTHVVQCLIGIYGSTEEEIINTIIKSWMLDNIDGLEKLGITMKVNGGNLIIEKSGEGWPYE